MKFKRILKSLLILAVLLLSPGLSWGQEVIKVFSSNIDIQSNGIMTVTEDITVQVENVNIQRGIYRDFPTKYKDSNGETIEVGLKVLDVFLDGATVPYRVTNRQNGVRIRIGDADSVVPRGEHTYSITYETTGQLGFFDDHDELYWNVTGNGWAFPIERVLATLSLPAGVSIKDIVWFTGSQGSREQAGKGSIQGNMAKFTTSRVLAPGEGFTIAAAWPKGFIVPDREYYKARDRSKQTTLLGRYVPLLAILLVLVYYLAVWFIHGKDLRPGKVIPLFYPPEKVKPATASFLIKQGYAEEAFTATIIDLAVRGYLIIEELGSSSPSSAGDFLPKGPLESMESLRSGKTEKTYILKRTEKTDGLDKMEEGLLGLLFSVNNTLVIDQASRNILMEARAFLKNETEETCRPLVKKNTPYIVAGIALTLLLTGGSGLLQASRGGNMGLLGFITVWLGMWTVGVFSLLNKVVKSLREGFTRGKISTIFKGFFLGALSIPFMIGQIVGMVILSESTSLFFTLALMAAMIINLLFARWMKNYSPLGRSIMNKLEGFKMYLNTAEKERIKRFARVDMPEDTPEQFEKMLPYAIALDVEKQWVKRFAHVLESSDYKPEWYVGQGNFYYWGTDSFVTGLNIGLSGAVDSAMDPPGSSSGFDGGGFSGGGGGGGGGGGW